MMMMRWKFYCWQQSGHGKLSHLTNGNLNHVFMVLPVLLLLPLTWLYKFVLQLTFPFPLFLLTFVFICLAATALLYYFLVAPLLVWILALAAIVNAHAFDCSAGILARFFFHLFRLCEIVRALAGWCGFDHEYVHVRRYPARVWTLGTSAERLWNNICENADIRHVEIEILFRQRSYSAWIISQMSF